MNKNCFLIIFFPHKLEHINKYHCFVKLFFSKYDFHKDIFFKTFYKDKLVSTYVHRRVCKQASKQTNPEERIRLNTHTHTHTHRKRA